MSRNTFGTWFIQHNTGFDVMHMFEPLYAKVFKTLRCEHSQADVKALDILLRDACNDQHFNEHVLALFELTSSAAVKKYIATLDDSKFSAMPTASAKRILAEVAAGGTRDIKGFISFLTFKPFAFIEEARERYEKMGFANAYASFNDFVDNILKEYLETQRDIPDDKFAFSLLALLCQHDKTSRFSAFKAKYFKVPFDKSLTSFSEQEVFNSILMNYNKLTTKALKGQDGVDLDGTFTNAMVVMKELAHSWDKLQASLNLRNEKLPQPVTGMTGGNVKKYFDSDIVKIYSGAYNLIDTKDTAEGNVYSDLVVNHKLFAQYPRQKQQAICSFLIANKARFNNIIKNASSTIIKYLNANLNDAVVNKALSNTIAMGSNNVVCNDVSKFSAHLSKAFNAKSMKTFADAADFIVHQYIPMLTAFNNRAQNKYNANAYGASMKMFYGNKALTIFGIADKFDDDEKVTVIHKTVIKQAQPTGMSGGGKDDIDSIFDQIYQDNKRVNNVVNAVPRMVAGDTQAQTLITSLRDVLQTFVDNFASCYRNFISTLQSITLSDHHDGASSAKLYEIIAELDTVSIKKKETPRWISGAFTEKDFNRLYRQALRALIVSIQSSGFKDFQPLVQPLEALFKLCKDVKQRVIEINNAYMVASKGAAELFSISAKSLKIDAPLTDKDYTAFLDACKRLYNQVGDAPVKRDAIYQQMMSVYADNISDRTKVIRDDYKTQKDYINFQHMQVTYDKRGKTPVEISQLEQMRNTRLTMTDRICEDVVFINEVVDPAILKLREGVKHQDLNREQLESIVNAWQAYRNVNTDTPDFKKLLHDLGKHFKPDERHTIAEWSQIIELIKKLIRKGGYFAMIKELHDKMHIAGASDIKWNDIEDKLYDIIAIKSIEFEHDDKDVAGVRNVNHAAALIDNVDGIGARAVQAVAGIGVAAQAFIAANDTSDRTLELLNATYKRTGYIKLEFNNNNTITSLKVDTTGQGVYGGGADKHHDTVAKSFFNIVDNAGGANPERHDLIALHNDAANKKYRHALKVIIDGINAIHGAASDAEADALILKWFRKIEYAVRHIEVITPFTVNDASNGKFKFESDLVKRTIEALSIDLLASFDNYFAGRYSGILALPTDVHTLLRGAAKDAKAAKQQGGSWFDFGTSHQTVATEVINEATPFYISAYKLLNWYFGQYINANAANNNKHMKIHKVSYLHPLYKLFKKGTLTTLDEMTDTEFKLFIDICNRLWQSVEGAPIVKLQQCVSKLTNELNSGIIYGSEELAAMVEHGASKGTLDQMAYANLKANIQGIAEAISNAIQESVDTTLTPEQNAKAYEAIMKAAIDKITKEDIPERKFAILKQLVKDKQEDKYLTDYYKFVELAIMPLITCANAYDNVFGIFNVMYRGLDANGGNNMLDIDLKFKFTDIMLGGNAKGVSIWELCELIRGGHDELKFYLLEHPAVYEYNRLILFNAFAHFHKTGQFKLPEFWVPIDTQSYPKQSVIKRSEDVKDNRIYYNVAFRIFKQLFPTAKDNTIGDFYSAACNEYAQDCEDLLNAYISYPGIPDRVRAAIADKVKSSFFDITTGRAKIFDKGHFDKLNKITLHKSRSILSPPVTGVGEVLSAVPPSAEAIGITAHEHDTLGNKYCRLGNTGFYIMQQFPLKGSADSLNIQPSYRPIEACQYTWFDYVVWELARCDRINMILPKQLISLIQSNNNLAARFKPCSAGVIKGTSQYAQNADGTFPCLLTQNILARSITPTIMKEAYGQLTKSHIANLVAVIPYLISTLRALKDTTDASVRDVDTTFNMELTWLIDILTRFYSDISDSTPFIPFMASSTDLDASTERPHLYAELCDLVANKDITSFAPGDFTKIECFNKFFFINEPLKFPEYKGKERADWLYKFAPEIVKDSSYAPYYRQSFNVLGKVTWMSIIAKAYGSNIDINVNTELDEVIQTVINIMCECDPDIVQRFIDVVIANYNGDVKHGLRGGDGKNDTIIETFMDDPAISKWLPLIDALYTSVNVIPTTRLATIDEKDTDASTTVTDFGKSLWAVDGCLDAEDLFKTGKSGITEAQLEEFAIASIVRNKNVAKLFKEKQANFIETFSKLHLTVLKEDLDKILDDGAAMSRDVASKYEAWINKPLIDAVKTLHNRLTNCFNAVQLSTAIRDMDAINASNIAAATVAAGIPAAAQCNNHDHDITFSRGNITYALRMNANQALLDNAVGGVSLATLSRSINNFDKLYDNVIKPLFALVTYYSRLFRELHIAYTNGAGVAVAAAASFNIDAIIKRIICRLCEDFATPFVDVVGGAADAACINGRVVPAAALVGNAFAVANYDIRPSVNFFNMLACIHAGDFTFLGNTYHRCEIHNNAANTHDNFLKAVNTLVDFAVDYINAASMFFSNPIFNDVTYANATKALLGYAHLDQALVTDIIANSHASALQPNGGAAQAQAWTATLIFNGAGDLRNAGNFDAVESFLLQSAFLRAVAYGAYLNQTDAIKQTNLFNLIAYLRMFVISTAASIKFAKLCDNPLNRGNDVADNVAVMNVIEVLKILNANYINQPGVAANLYDSADNKDAATIDAIADNVTGSTANADNAAARCLIAVKMLGLDLAGNHPAAGAGADDTAVAAAIDNAAPGAPGAVLTNKLKVALCIVRGTIAAAAGAATRDGICKAIEGAAGAATADDIRQAGAAGDYNGHAFDDLVGIAHNTLLAIAGNGHAVADTINEVINECVDANNPPAANKFTPVEGKLLKLICATTQANMTAHFKAHGKALLLTENLKDIVGKNDGDDFVGSFFDGTANNQADEVLAQSLFKTVNAISLKDVNTTIERRSANFVKMLNGAVIAATGTVAAAHFNAIYPTIVTAIAKINAHAAVADTSIVNAFRLLPESHINLAELPVNNDCDEDLSNDTDANIGTSLPVFLATRNTSQAIREPRDVMTGGKLTLTGGVIVSRKEAIFRAARGIAVQPLSRLVYVAKPGGDFKEPAPAAAGARANVNINPIHAAPGAAAPPLPALPVNLPIFLNDVVCEYVPWKFPGANKVLDSISVVKDYTITPYLFKDNAVAVDLKYNAQHYPDTLYKTGDSGTVKVLGETYTINTTGVNNVAQPLNEPQVNYKYCLKKFYKEPSIKNITFNVEAFGKVPMSPAVMMAIASPRKSIYNATFTGGSGDIFRAPVLIYEYGVADNCKLIDGNNHSCHVNLVKVNNIDKYVPNVITYASLHNKLRDVAPLQYFIEQPGHGAALVQHDHYFDIANNKLCDVAAAAGQALDAANYYKELIKYDANDDSVHVLINNLTAFLNNFIVNDDKHKSVFDVDASSNKGLTYLKGGRTLGEDFYKLNNAYGTSVKELLGNAYGARVADLPDAIKSLYSNIFGLPQGRGQQQNADAVLSTIMSYFNTTSVNASAIYQQVAFPSIAYNSIIYKSFVDSIKGVLTEGGVAFKDNMSKDTQGLYKFIKAFIDAYHDVQGTLIDKCSISNQTIDAIANNRRKKALNFDDAINGLNNNNQHPEELIGNMYTMPSVNSSYLAGLLRAISPLALGVTNDKANEPTGVYALDNDERQYAACMNELEDSTALTFIRLLDVNNTFLYCVSMLAKFTSWYDFNDKAEKAYSQLPDIEPLALRI